MPKSTLLRAKLVCSRVGFGGSRLHYLLGRKQRHTLLQGAFDCGINYFDVAPLYGFGLAERALGEFLRSHRSERNQIVVATKWGYAADPILNRLPGGLVTTGYFLARIKQILSRSKQRESFNRHNLLESVEGSLRRLQTERIDILWMHEPELALFSNSEEIYEAFCLLQSAGKVHHFGVAGYSANMKPVWDLFSPFHMLYQCEESGWDDSLVPDVTFSALSEGVQRINASAVEEKSIGPRLNRALKRRKQGVVLVSTTKADNLRQLSSIASECQ